MKNIFSLIIGLATLVGCSQKSNESTTEAETEGLYKKVGEVVFLDSALTEIIDIDAQPEVLASGFDWTEGPLWIEEHSMLLFTDIPKNAINQWTEKDGVKEFLNPSGYTGTIPRGGEPGANGLLLNKEGKLILCQHGDRRIALWEGDYMNPNAEYKTLADQYDGKKFNSPNDAALFSDGSIYFTDPPYGMVNQENDSSKEMAFQGVYKIKSDHSVSLLLDSLERPNGIAFSNDYKKMYVANSYGEKARWYEYSLDSSGEIVGGKIFFDGTSLLNENKGLPDGMAVHKKGYIFGTGPGGVLVFSPEGRHL
ncbi:MAG: SMP-30/gluconolactonase/LRE family protein, partial [Cyclobacteriaceae bacterium]|nr:SMP-30/gluconolactonase/LRE family protein [Cyclobacteriaceae bacterium]